MPLLWLLIILQINFQIGNFLHIYTHTSHRIARNGFLCPGEGLQVGLLARYEMRCLDGTKLPDN